MTNPIERLIAGHLIDTILKAGHPISVNDGEETTLCDSMDKAAILAAMFTTDEDYLILRQPLTGWIRLIWGNGEDVISDYSTNLESLIAPTNKYADTINEALPALVERLQAVNADLLNALRDIGACVSLQQALEFARAALAKATTQAGVTQAPW